MRKHPVDGMQDVYTYNGVHFEKSTVEGDDIQPAYRCDTVIFDEVWQEADVSHTILTIGSIFAYPSEGEFCSPALLKRAQAFLDARSTGIQVKCSEAAYIDGLEVASKPATLSLEETQAVIFTEEFIISLYGIQGPWVFEFSQ